MKLLLLAESDGAHVLPSTLQAVTFAQSCTQTTGGAFDLLICGDEGISTSDWLGFGAHRVLTALSSDLAHPIADRVAAATVGAFSESGADSVAAPSSTF